MKFKYFVDSGHAWLKVPIKLLIDLKINTKISKYSHRRGDYAYLEEDCDATIFINALKASGKTFEYVEQYSENSRVRSYEPYKIFDYDVEQYNMIPYIKVA